MSSDQLVPELIEARAAADPQAIAVSCAGEDVTYGRLNARANQLAHRLRGRGVGKESVVAVRFPRGTEYIAILLGILKSGAAYLPCDPMLPADRLEYMLRSAGASLVLTDPMAARQPGVTSDAEVEILDVSQSGAWPEHDPELTLRSRNLAYVIFTSGSTGRPKPVAVEHRSLTAHARAVTELWHLTAGDRVLQFANAGFDVLAEEVFPTLACGGRVVILPDPTIPAADLEHFLAEHAVTVANIPTPLWSHWTADLDEEPRPLPASLRLLIVGSDAGYVSTLATWQKHSGLPVANAYGVTESTITATWALFEAPNLPEASTLPIGRPIPGARAYVLDAQLREVSPGTPGELYLGGLPLARGYHGQPELTAGRFVPDHLGGRPGARLYRTGDRAKVTAAGWIELIGRVDDQVKIRGFRVEPSEVTHVLASHEHVAECYVAAIRGGTEQGDVTLAGDVVPANPRYVPSAAGLRTYLAQRLPDYMIPATFIIVDALPTTPAGKVDYRSLPAYTPDALRAAAPYQPPRRPIEQLIAQVWQEVLRARRIGIDDDIFELGGHSLTMMRIAARLAALGIRMSARDLAAHPTIRGLARHLDGTAAAREPLPPVMAEPAGERAPLTFQQEQVWFLAKLVSESIAYHAQTTIRIIGQLRADVLDRTITEIARRHEILRTTFEEADGTPWQVVHPAAEMTAVRVELAKDAVENYVQGLLKDPFDPSVLPLIRWTLIKVSESEFELVLVEHHLIHDGWSFALLMGELTAIYNAFAAGRPSPLADAGFQYGDYARWQRAALGSPALTSQRAYWARRLAEQPPPLALPYDRPRPKVQTFGGQTLRVELPPSLPGAVRAFCRHERTTLFTVLYAAFAVLLHRYTGERDICLGSAFANRQQIETQGLLGMLVNTVLLRCEVSGRAPFRDLVRQCHEVLLDAGANQELPFGELVRTVNPDRDLTRNPLSQVLFSANDSPLPDMELTGASATIFERGNGSSKMDLDVVVIPRAESRFRKDTDTSTDDRIMLLWEYNTDLFDESTMRRMIDGYFRLLGAAVTEPDLPVGDLPLLSEAEQDRVLRRWNPAETGSEFAPVHLEVLAQARRAPNAIAVVEGQRSVSYGELVDLSRRVAGTLRRHGGTAGSIIAVCLPRGIDLVVAELGVLLAGAAYLPIDPDNPRDRIGYMLSDARAVSVITTAEFSDRLPADASLVRLEQAADGDLAPPHEPSPVDAAYAIYTSGSTGRPKGVLVEHGSLANLARWRRRAYRITAADRMTMFASPGFDPTVSDIWPTLTAGASVHVPDPEIRMLPHALARWLVAGQITMAELPTPLAESLLLLPWPVQCQFRLLIAGGDRLHLRPAADLPFELSNEYGPTENTATSTWDIVQPGETGLNPPIGRPITGTRGYILDPRLRPIPPGACGELYLGGGGVARGYLGRPALTAGRFVPDPFSREPGARMYRTGDQARHLHDGRIEFLGRVDAQIKLRGYRIEPGEIVAALRRHPDIADAYVTSDGSRLVGYLVGKAGSQAGAAPIRDLLAAELPSYMVPTAFVFLDKLPTSASGKVDRRRLPVPAQAGEASEPPATELEHRLARIWRQVLGVETVGATDSFFDLGGHSLLLGQVHYRLSSELDLALSIVTLFEYPTIRSLAGYLNSDGPGDTAERERRGRVRRDARSQVERRRAIIRSEELR